MIGKKGGKLTIYKMGQINRHGPTPPRKYAIKHEHPEYDDPVTHYTQTHIIGAAAEYVALAVRSIQPAELVWDHGTEEAQNTYNRLAGLTYDQIQAL